METILKSNLNKILIFFQLLVEQGLIFFLYKNQSNIME